MLLRLITLIESIKEIIRIIAWHPPPYKIQINRIDRMLLLDTDPNQIGN